MTEETQTESPAPPKKASKTPKVKINPTRISAAIAIALLLSAGVFEVVSHIHAKKRFDATPTAESSAMTTRRLQQLSKEKANARPPAEGPNASSPDSPLPDGSIKDPFEMDADKNTAPPPPPPKNAATEGDDPLTETLPPQKAQTPATTPQSAPATTAPAPAPASTPTAAIPAPTPTQLQTPSTPTAPADDVPTSRPTPSENTHTQNTDTNDQDSPISGTEDLKTLGALPNPYVDPSAMQAKMPAFENTPANTPLQTEPLTNPQTQSLTDQEQALQAEIQADQEKLKNIQSQIAASHSGHLLPSLPNDPQTPEATPSDIPTNVIPDTTLVAGTQNAVVISRNGKTSVWKMGSIIPGIGRTKSLIPWESSWQLVTESGLVRPQTTQTHPTP